RQLAVRIAAVEQLAPSLRRLTLSSPDMPQTRAGQIVLARAGAAFDPYLRLACFPIAGAASDTCYLLVSNDDAAARSIYDLPAGHGLDLIAPVGNGFTLEPTTQRLLLLGNALPAAPLIALAREATGKRIAVTLLISSQAAMGGQW